MATSCCGQSMSSRNDDAEDGNADEVARVECLELRQLPASNALVPPEHLYSPASPSILAFASWHIQAPDTYLHEPGRLYCAQQGAGRMSCVPHVEMPEGIVRQHPRDNGCEHQVFLHLTRAVSRVGAEPALCRGRLRLFLSHWPSTSALIAVVVFMKHFPAVRLEIHYDSFWASKHEAKICACTQLLQAKLLCKSSNLSSFEVNRDGNKWIIDGRDEELAAGTAILT